jgi:hypothetical protein
VNSTSCSSRAATVRSGPFDVASYAGGGADGVEEPLLYAVEEAAAVLRIGRTLAYRMARRHELSGGREGLPVIRLGNCLRVLAGRC